MHTEEKNRITGKRLDECLRKKGMTAKLLADIIGEKRDPPLSEVYLSQMRTGKRPINYKNAVLFSECLGIDQGYLLGDDDFKAESYREYQMIMGKEEQKEKDLPELKEYAKVIELAGYFLKVNFNGKTVETHPDGTTSETEYSTIVTNGKYSATITASAMRNITDRVKRYATDLYDAEVLRNQRKVYDSSEEFEKAREEILERKK